MNKDKKNLIYIIVAFAFILLFPLIPAPDGLNVVSMEAIGLFIGIMIMWNFVSTDWPSFLCMALVAIFGIMEPSAIFTTGFGNSTIAFLLVFFMLSHVLSQVGFSRRLAIWFMTNKLARKSPWAFITMFLFGAMFLASFMSQTAALLIFLPIAEQIFQELNYGKGNRVAQMIVLGLGIAVGIGSANTPLGHAIILIPIQLLQDMTGQTVNIVSYSIFGVATGIIIFAVLILVYRFIYRPDVSALKGYDVTHLRSSLPEMDKKEKISATLFVIVIIIWFVQSCFSDIIIPLVGVKLSSLGNAIPVMVAIVILCMWKVDGKPIMDYKESVSKGVPWSALIFNAAVLVLSGTLTLEDVGISNFLIEKITPLVGDLSQTVFILIIAALCIIATNFSSNTVCATVFFTISAPIALAMGNVNMVALASVIAASASYAFATPPATMPMAVVAGTGWVDVKQMFKYGGLMAIVSIIVVVFIGYPIAAAVL